MKKQSFFPFVKSLILIMIIPIASFGQSGVKPVDSHDVFNHFNKLYQIDARLVNGDFYNTPSISKATGHPFFISSDWKNGSVSMEGVVFENLQLRYDISSGLIILNTAGFTNTAVQLVLKKDRIDYFTMDGNLFQAYPDDDPMTGIRFCQVLEEGAIDFVLIRSKNLKVTTTGRSDFAYQTKQSRIIRIGDELHPYLSRHSLIKLYPDLKPDLRLFLKENRLRFKKMSNNEHARFVKYCNSLIESSQ